MHSHTTDDEQTCPLCDQPYEKMVRVEMGQRFADVFGGTFWDFVTKYDRRCTTRQHPDEDGRDAHRSERLIFFHRRPRVTR